jgi:uncharacterized protein (DUF488 family)
MLFTIGYEGAEIARFLSKLAETGIKKVVDVRDVPVSRRRGFSKTALTNALSENGIEYIHLKALGDPKPGREAARQGNFATFRKIYSIHLRKKAAQDALSIAAAEVRQTKSALLCYERDYRNCHRSIVADALSELTKLEIRHITVGEDAKIHPPLTHENSESASTFW